jgi:SH3-like domain-containing protein
VKKTLLAVLCFGVFALAQTFGPVGTARADPVDAAEASEPTVTLGPETNLPLPRFVSLKADEANVRRGPSLTHRIDWVFTRRDMPLMVVAEYGHWRRVVDREGLGGWIHYAMLSGARTVIVDQDMEPLYASADTASPQNAVLEAGVIARLVDCEGDWCRLSAGGYRGWAPKAALWGVDLGKPDN